MHWIAPAVASARGLPCPDSDKGTNVIKITQSNPSNREAVIRIEGRLDVESVTELCAIVRQSEGQAVCLEISGLDSIDRAGGRCLARLRDSGCRVAGGSLYIRRLLEEVAP
jgi:anti-anti-sigma regulatory factor